jgi:hypothetical protein
MPPRYAYWTIIIDDAPTAFRARDRADLMPTFRQLTSRNPNATIKWFANGRLWESPEEARAAAKARREPRDADWRPAGRHEAAPRGCHALRQAQGVVSVSNHAGGPAEDPRLRSQKREPERGRDKKKQHRGAAAETGGRRPGASGADRSRQDATTSGKRSNDRWPWSGRDRRTGAGGSDRERRNQRSGNARREGNASRRERQPWGHREGRPNREESVRNAGKPGASETPSEPEPPERASAKK